jgi:uncharacterized Fe-S cluster protein YjdI
MNERRTPGNREKAKALVGRAHAISAHELIMRIYSQDESLKIEKDAKDGHCYICMRGIGSELSGSRVSWEDSSGEWKVSICDPCYSGALDYSIIGDN